MVMSVDNRMDNLMRLGKVWRYIWQRHHGGEYHFCVMGYLHDERAVIHPWFGDHMPV